jgi:lipopolysaccharide/colanic/teichoic acid biosynthesis glycosyltransferase
MLERRVIRLFDILISALALLLIFPLFAFISIGIIIETGFPIFFIQKRIGLNLKIFSLYKFRSMYYDPNRNTGEVVSNEMNADSINALYITTSPNDRRISPFGKTLRRLSLDELPQILNVLRGEMSFVGPRPDTPVQVKDYTIEDWIKRHKIKPGITGLAQINGRSNLTSSERLSYDLQLVENLSLKLYIAIIYKTFIGIVNTKNVN